MKAFILGLALVLSLPSTAYSVGQAWPEPVRATVCRPCKSETLTDLGEWTITAYCGCEICCGKWAKNRPGGKVVGASGVELRRGFCASPLPLGSVLLVEGIGQYMVHDRTSEEIVGRYGGRIIDIYFETHEEAVKFGKRTARVWLVQGKWQGNQRGENIKMGPVVSTKTKGWRPTCSCGLEPVPCTILDPFGGSGTVSYVAQRYGRSSIYIDLNPKYRNMAIGRMQPEQPSLVQPYEIVRKEVAG